MKREFDEVTDLPLENHQMYFEADASQKEVPLGMAICRFSNLLLAIDHHLYHTGKLTEEQARDMIRDAAAKMDRKFDIPYQKLPQ